MAKVPHGVETLPKISIAWVGCTNVTDDRQTDGRGHIANVNFLESSLQRLSYNFWVWPLVCRLDSVNWKKGLTVNIVYGGKDSVVSLGAEVGGPPLMTRHRSGRHPTESVNFLCRWIYKNTREDYDWLKTSPSNGFHRMPRSLTSQNVTTSVASNHCLNWSKLMLTLMWPFLALSLRKWRGQFLATINHEK